MSDTFEIDIVNEDFTVSLPSDSDFGIANLPEDNISLSFESIGIPGPPGGQGLSAYQIAVNNGFVGTEEEWLATISSESRSYRLSALTTAMGAAVPAAVIALTVERYSPITPITPARYINVSSQPAHELKFQSSDNRWWEIAEGEIDVCMAGAVGDNATDDRAAFNRAASLGRSVVYYGDASPSGLASRIYRINGPLVFYPGQALIGPTGRNGARLDFNIGNGVDLEYAFNTVYDEFLPSDTIVSKTAAYTAVVGDCIRVDATSGAFTITLPTSPAHNSVVKIKKIDDTSNLVTIAGGVANTVKNLASVQMQGKYFFYLRYVSSTGDWTIEVPHALRLENIWMRGTLGGGNSRGIQMEGAQFWRLDNVFVELFADDQFHVFGVSDPSTGTVLKNVNQNYGTLLTGQGRGASSARSLYLGGTISATNRAFSESADNNYISGRFSSSDVGIFLETGTSNTFDVTLNSNTTGGLRCTAYGNRFMLRLEDNGDYGVKFEDTGNTSGVNAERNAILHLHNAGGQTDLIIDETEENHWSYLDTTHFGWHIPKSNNAWNTAETNDLQGFLIRNAANELVYKRGPSDEVILSLPVPYYILDEFAGATDTAKLQAAAAFMKTLITAGPGGLPTLAARLVFPSRPITITECIDFSMIQAFGWVLDFSGCVINLETTGKYGFNFLGSRAGIFIAPRIVGSTTSTPLGAFLFGRNQVDRSCGEFTLYTPQFSGVFSEACTYWLASETNTMIGGEHANSSPSATAYCSIVDGSNVLTAGPTAWAAKVGPGQTVPNMAQFTSMSNTMNNYIGTTFRRQVTGPCLWLGGNLTGVHFTNSYFVSPNDTVIKLYDNNSSGGINIHIDGYGETIGVKTFIEFERRSLGTVSVRGLRHYATTSQIGEQYIKLGTNVSALVIDDGDIHVSSGQVTPSNGFCNNPGALTYKGDLWLPSSTWVNTALPNLGFSSFRGRFDADDLLSPRHYLDGFGAGPAITLRGDADYTILPTDSVVSTAALFTAPRNWTLPAANSVPAGKRLRIQDLANGISKTNSVTINRAGSDTIHGSISTSSVVLNKTGMSIEFISNGTNIWGVVRHSTSFREVGDAGVTISLNDRTVATNAAFTTPRIWTLPAAASFPTGENLIILDMVGAVSATNTLTIQRVGADTINGATTKVLNAPFTSVILRSDGVSKWHVEQAGAGADDQTATEVPVSPIPDIAGLNVQAVLEELSADKTSAPSLGYINVQEWGFHPDNTAVVNDTAIALVAAEVASLYAAGTPLPRIIFPEGIYLFSSWPDFAFDHLEMEGHGDVILRYTGAGNAITFDATARATQRVRKMRVTGLRLQAPSTSGDGFTVNRCHDCDFDLDVRGCGTAAAAFKIKFNVISRFRLTASVNDGGWYNSGSGAAKPNIGIDCSGDSAVTPPSYCTFRDSTIEGTNYGAWFDQSLGNLFIGGTLEGCTIEGAHFTTNSRNNKIHNVDFEAQPLDVSFDGRDNVIKDCDTFTQVTFQATALRCGVIGGVHSDIVTSVGALACMVFDLSYNRFNDSSVFTDNGTGTRKRSLYNVGTGVTEFGGTGDVSGPASSVLNRVAIFSNTTGKLLADSGFTVQQIRHYVDLRDYGAVGNGTTDDTDEIQAFLDAEPGRIHFAPKGRYLIRKLTGSQILLLQRPMYLVGEGAHDRSVAGATDNGTVFLVASDVPTTIDAMRLAFDPLVTSNEANFFGGIKGIRIKAESGSPGRDCLFIDVADSNAAFNAKFDIDQCWFGPLNRRALSMTKNGTTYINGWFTSVVERSRFDGGAAADYVCWLHRSGDSFTFKDNTVTGEGMGVFTQPVSGAAIQEFLNNNVTSKGGAFYVFNDGTSGSQVLIEANQIEQFLAYTGTDFANIVVDGLAAVVIRDNNLLGNHLTGGKVSNILLKNNAIHTVIEDNVMSVSAADGRFHIVNQTGQRLHVDPHQKRLLVDGALVDIITVDGTIANKNKLFNVRAIGNASETILPHETLVYPSAAFTAARTWTLPLSSSVPPGHSIKIIDHINVFTPGFPLTIARQGALDSINGATTFLLNHPREVVEFINQGGGFWVARLLDNKYVSIGDAPYVIVASDRVVAATTNLTAVRTWTLPAASAYPVGTPLTIIDMAGVINGANNIVIARAGSDNIEGKTSFTLDAPRQQLVLYSNGVNGWSVGRELVLGVHVRDKLLTHRTYYVRTGGNDSNDGLTNVDGGAFLTIAKALAVVASIDLAGFTATIQVQDGTWTVPVSLPALVGGTAILQGNTATPTNCIIDTHTGSGGTAVTCSNVGWKIRGFQIKASVFGVLCNNNGTLEIQQMDFGICSNFQLYAQGGGRITVTGVYSISANAPRHWAAFDTGSIVCQSKTITLTGTPAFTSFAIASRLGVMAVNGNTYSGSATGARFALSLGGVIDTATGDVNHLPGSTAGSLGTAPNTGMYA